MASKEKPPFKVRPGFQKAKEEGSKSGVLATLLKQARKSGQLNLSNRELTEVPVSVWRVNEDLPEESKQVTFDTEDRWWEQVDLNKLILASNALCELSEDIRLLPALTVLDIHDNRLQTLPDAVGELSGLNKLNLGHNNLGSIPECIGRLSNLQILQLQYNQIVELPDSIGRLHKLEELDLSHNKIPKVPQSVGMLNGLFRLNLSDNSICVLPHEVGCLTSLRMLECTHNQIHTLPDELGNLSHLEQLYLRHNRLTHLPLLHSCTALKELHVGNNSLQGLTVEHLESLRAVSFLDLRDNRIAKIPEEIVVLEELERLDLTNNSLTTLPYVMGTMKKLKSIVLDGNPMKGIRRDIIMRGTNEVKKHLSSRLEVPPETSVQPPAAVKQTTGTSGIIGGKGEGVDAHAVSTSKSLDYSNKKVAVIPEDLWSVVEEAGVTVVNFSKNQLTALPEKLTVASGTLSELNLGINRLTVLDSSIGQFTRLVMLDLRTNQLSDLPDEMERLQLLRELTIACNRFPKIPEVVYKLGKLEVLLASDNQIQTVDASALQGMKQLATLDLQNNNISQVPPELGLCEQLRLLQLEGNPSRQPRPAILAKGTVAILEYLRGRIPNT